MPAGEVESEDATKRELVESLKNVEDALRDLTKARAAEKEASDEAKPTMGEWVRSTLALFVVIFLLSVFGFVWIVLGMQNVERAVTVLLPLVTLVLGYYFGKEGKRAAQEQAARAGQEAKDAAVREQKEKVAKEGVKKGAITNLKTRVAGLETDLESVKSEAKDLEKKRDRP